ncbi:hypothetical protein [Aquimarina macrocephali]|uniref:hypothetical protein n=1 Tax=Aquimarina macrocephali TaxID=666563 RepID=UPI000466ACB8|nr:hypothetical protein [Aquimarina macrocephali]
MKNINSIKTLNRSQLHSTKGGSSPHGAGGGTGNRFLLNDSDYLGITYSGHGIGDGTGQNH